VGAGQDRLGAALLVETVKTDPAVAEGDGDLDTALGALQDGREGSVAHRDSKAAEATLAQRGAMVRRMLMAAAVLAAAGPALADAAADEAAIRGRLAAWAQAFNDRDAEGACDLFAPDLVYAVPGLAEGSRETMCGNLARQFARTDFILRYAPPEIHEVIVEGDLAVVRLTWTLTLRTLAKEETSVEDGIDVFRRQPDGRWSIARFIAVTRQP
jgi:steroid delta-isomerase